MSTIEARRRRVQKSTPPKSPLNPHQRLARDLDCTARELREHLADLAGLVDDLEAQSRRVRRLGGDR